MKNIYNHPLISCLCITRMKPKLLYRAISCFLRQTYPNKELVIIYEDDDFYTKDFLSTISNPYIHIYEVKKSSSTTLGFLRNYAIQVSKGIYICQWDDDDWYHITRLQYQFEHLQRLGKPACVLTQWLVFDSMEKKAYVSHNRLWEGSLLAQKNVVDKFRYDNIRKGEDTSVIEKLNKSNKLIPLDNAANLYIYIYHGNNTWNYGHWKSIFACSYELNALGSRLISNLLYNRGDINEDSKKVDMILKEFNKENSNKQSINLL